EPLLAPLSDAGEIQLVEVQIGEADANELADTKPRGIEQFDHRAIAQTERRRDVGLGDERLDVGRRQQLRQRRPRARRAQAVGRNSMIVSAVCFRGPEGMPVRSKWQSLPTEQINPATLAIDKLAPADIVEGMLNEDRKMLAAVQHEKDRIAVGVDIITGALRK